MCVVYLRHTQTIYDVCSIFTTYTEYLRLVQYIYDIHRLFTTCRAVYLRRTDNIYDVHRITTLSKCPRTCLRAVVHTALPAERIFTELLQVCVSVFVSRCLPGRDEGAAVHSVLGQISVWPLGRCVGQSDWQQRSVVIRAVEKLYTVTGTVSSNRDCKQ